MIISYQLLLYLLLPVFIGFSIKHVLSNKNSLFLWQRFGLKTRRLTNPVWFHCASVGEVMTAIPLIKLYHQTFPEKEILLTTNTITGANLCQKQLNFVTHNFLPLDYRFITRLFLKKIKPEKLIILETEIWPNLFQLCHKQGISINIINGRLSKRSLDINRWSKSIYKQTLSHVDKILCRSFADAEAYQFLGADKNQIEVTGNLKFATPLDIKDTENLINREYVLVASTHTGEEKILTELWQQTQHDELLLVIAPRHPERKDDIINDIKPYAGEIRIRSKNQTITTTTDIYLADTLGELPALFQHAKFVIMGGSFVNKGGHNILEPAAFSRAILYGPSMENFAAEDILFKDHKAAIQAVNNQQAVKEINHLISDSDYRTSLGNNARKLMLKYNGVAESYLNKIKD